MNRTDLVARLTGLADVLATVADVPAPNLTVFQTGHVSVQVTFWAGPEAAGVTL